MNSFECTQCSKEFATKSALTHHYKTIHEDLKCQHLDAYSKQDPPWLVKHPHTVLYKCTEECGRSYQSRKALVYHQKTYHQWRQCDFNQYQGRRKAFSYEAMLRLVRDYSTIKEDKLVDLSKEIEEILQIREFVKNSKEEADN